MPNPEPSLELESRGDVGPPWLYLRLYIRMLTVATFADPIIHSGDGALLSLVGAPLALVGPCASD
jgi:hypothetical protein